VTGSVTENFIYFHSTFTAHLLHVVSVAQERR